MKDFLQQPGAAFYHITDSRKLESIRKYGLIASQGGIYVSRVDDHPILATIICHQLRGNDDVEEYVVLKLPQHKNNFESSEIKRDDVYDGWSSHFQNKILRTSIPFENIEIMKRIKVGPYEVLDNGYKFSPLMLELTNISKTAYDEYKSLPINEIERNRKYDK